MTSEIPLVPSKKTILTRLDGEQLVPINDHEAWKLKNNRAYVYLYDRLVVTQSQGIKCGPMGTLPEKFPAVIKPITNLSGTDKGATKVDDLEGFNKLGQLPGYFWMEHLTGDHVMFDLFFNKGRVVWKSVLRGVPGKSFGSFVRWDTDPDYVPPDRIRRWVDSYFDGYTGAANMTVIGKRVIDIHLCPGDINIFDAEMTRSLFNELIKIYSGDGPEEGNFIKIKVPELSVMRIRCSSMEKGDKLLIRKLHEKYPFRGLLLNSNSENQQKPCTIVVYDSPNGAEQGRQYFKQLIDKKDKPNQDSDFKTEINGKQKRGKTDFPMNLRPKLNRYVPARRHDVKPRDMMTNDRPRGRQTTTHLRSERPSANQEKCYGSIRPWM